MKIVQNPNYTSEEELEGYIHEVDESMSNLLDSIGLDDHEEGRVYNNLKNLADKTREIKNDELKLAYNIFGKELAHAENLLDGISEEHGEEVRDKLRTYFEEGEIPDVDSVDYSGERLLGEFDEDYENKSYEDKIDEVSAEIAHIYDRLENMDEELMKGIVDNLPEREELLEEQQENQDNNYGLRKVGIGAEAAGYSAIVGLMKAFELPYWKEIDDADSPLDVLFKYDRFAIS